MSEVEPAYDPRDDFPKGDRRLMTELMQQVFGSAGYTTELSLSPTELRTLRSLTREAWLNRISNAAPEMASHFSNIGIEDYHHHAHLLPQDDLWTYADRHFSIHAVEEIKTFSVFEVLRENFPGFIFTGRNPPHEDLGRTRMVWRIVRPGAGVDVGPCHADYWFDAVQTRTTNYPMNHIPVKLWIPLWNDVGKTGLSVIYGSHRSALSFGSEMRDGVVKPTCLAQSARQNETLLSTEPGTLVIFSDRLLHRGHNSPDAVNTRVSVEIVLLVPRDVIRRSCDQPVGLDVWSPPSA